MLRRLLQVLATVHLDVGAEGAEGVSEGVSEGANREAALQKSVRLLQPLLFAPVEVSGVDAKADLTQTPSKTDVAGELQRALATMVRAYHVVAPPV